MQHFVMQFLVASCMVWSITLAAPPDGFTKMRNEVISSEIFQSKVHAACQNQGDDCTRIAESRLFCELLRRSRPELANAHCSRPAAAFVQVTSLRSGLRARAAPGAPE